MNVSRTSRYKDTPVIGPQETSFGLFACPDEFVGIPQDSMQTHRVTSLDIGMLDRVAAKYYGAGNETMWWTIAIANGIVDQETDMYIGQVLVIPPQSALTGFVTRSSNG